MNNISQETKKMEFTEEELNHAKILEDLSLINRSSKHKFTEDTRLRKIRELLAETEYSETFTQQCFSLWSKVPLSELPKDIILISSHTDVVGSITKCSSKLDEESGFYTGTYDNQGTNAALVIMMKEHIIPDNVVFAFTGDEETGRCAGAKQTVALLRSLGKNPICIALDVTYEGYYQNKLYSLENLTGAEQGIDFVNRIAKSAMTIEPEDANTFCFVAANKHTIPTTIDNSHDSKTTGMYDEAFAYRDVSCKAMSVCLPCFGEMHSNSGVKVKQPVFEGYIFSLVSLIYEITHTHEQMIEAFKTVRKELVKKAKEVQTLAYHENYSSSSYYNYESAMSRYFHNYDETEYEDDDEIAAYNAGYGSIYDSDYDSYDTYDDELLMLKSLLASDAMEYSADEMDVFITDTSIPTEFMHCFQYDANGDKIEDEEEAIEAFLKEVFIDTHIYELEDMDDNNYYNY